MPQRTEQMHRAQRTSNALCWGVVAHAELLNRVLDRPGGIPCRNLAVSTMADTDAALRELCNALMTLIGSFGDVPKLGELKEVLHAVMVGMRDLAYSIGEGIDLVDSAAITRKNSVIAQEATDSISRLYNARTEAVPLCPFPLYFEPSARGPHVAVGVRQGWLKVD